MQTYTMGLYDVGKTESVFCCFPFLGRKQISEPLV